MTLGDVDGDGRADLIAFLYAGVYVAYSRGDHFSAPTLETGAFAGKDGWDQDQHPRFVADLDGDGKSDLIGFADTGTHVALSTGTGLSDQGQVLAGFGENRYRNTADYPRTLADVNGDGAVDIVGFAAGGVEVALGKGDGHFQVLGSRLGQAVPVLADFGYNQGWRGERHLRTLAGGTASRLGGGKFANGAVTAAMSYLFASSAQANQKNRAGNGGLVDAETAQAHFAEARANVLRDLKNGSLDIGLGEEYIKGGFDSIEFKLTADLGGAAATVTYKDLGYGPVKDVVMTMSYSGVASMAEAYTSFGHEFRHLTLYNRKLNKDIFNPNLSGPNSPQELDAERYGIFARNHYGY